MKKNEKENSLKNKKKTAQQKKKKLKHQCLTVDCTVQCGAQ